MTKIKKLSKQKIKTYISNNNVCPYCGEENLSGDFFNTEDGIATQTVVCADCGKEWTDIYKLVNIQE